MITRRSILSGLLLTVAPLAKSRAFAAERVRMFELYGEEGEFSRRAMALQGQRVAIQGFMAPHLKVDSDFFILSNTPVETCPFCASEGDWMETIVFVRMRRKQEAVDPGTLIVAEGTLEIGPATDAETGFVSKVRLVDADFRKSGR